MRSLVRPLVAAAAATAMAGAALVSVAAGPAAAATGDCGGVTFAGGTGSLDDPYQVATAAQLQAIGTNGSNLNGNCMDENYVQTADLNASGIPNWTPLGYNYNGFKGVYYGGCRSISNVTVHHPADDNVGLFQWAWESYIRNVRLVNVSVTGSALVGGIAGMQRGGKIIESSVQGAVSGRSDIGLVAGRVQRKGALIEHVTASGSVTATSTGGAVYAGGLVGQFNGDQFTTPYTASVIRQSWNAATVSATSAINGGSGAAGGVAGIVNVLSQVVDSYSTGTVTSTSTNGSVSSGGIEALVNNFAESTLTRTYATGAVTAPTPTAPGTASAGGIMAEALGTLTSTGNYWDSQTTGQATTADGPSSTTTTGAATTAQMKTASTFAGWDPTVWNLSDGSYPTLTWFDNNALTSCPAISGLDSAYTDPAGGGTVRIYGTGMTKVSAVLFGSTPSTGLAAAADGSYLDVVAPAGTGTVDVVLKVDPGLTVAKAVNAITYAAPAPTPVASGPVSVSAKAGATATFAVAAAPATGYQWQSSTDGGTIWSDIAGATEASYTTPSLSQAQNGTLFRVVVTNAPGGYAPASTTSVQATLTVTPAGPTALPINVVAKSSSYRPPRIGLVTLVTSASTTAGKGRIVTTVRCAPFTASALHRAGDVRYCRAYVNSANRVTVRTYGWRGVRITVTQQAVPAAGTTGYAASTVFKRTWRVS